MIEEFKEINKFTVDDLYGSVEYRTNERCFLSEEELEKYSKSSKGKFELTIDEAKEDYLENDIKYFDASKYSDFTFKYNYNEYTFKIK